jgi:hypothetical protein
MHGSRRFVRMWFVDLDDTHSGVVRLPMHYSRSRKGITRVTLLGLLLDLVSRLYATLLPLGCFPVVPREQLLLAPRCHCQRGARLAKQRDLHRHCRHACDCAGDKYLESWPLPRHRVGTLAT